MRKYLFCLMATSLITSACSKDNLENSSFKFNINGKVFVTNYDTSGTVLPKQGTFRFDYSPPNSTTLGKYRIIFWAFLDQETQANLEIFLTESPIINKVYKTGSTPNYSSVTFDIYSGLGTLCNIGQCIDEVIFTSFKYPGRIAGTVKSSNSGILVGSGEFNFVVQ